MPHGKKHNTTARLKMQALFAQINIDFVGLQYILDRAEEKG